MIEFSRWLGYVAVGILFVGVANSLSMTVRDRVREFGILKTMGFRRTQVLFIIVSEATITAFIGGVVGALAAFFLINFGTFALSVEGFTISPHVSPALLAAAAFIAALVGLFGGLLPSYRASRLRIVQTLRGLD
jgi:putative ABC transport system permease protein